MGVDNKDDYPNMQSFKGPADESILGFWAGGRGGGRGSWGS